MLSADIMTLTIAVIFLTIVCTILFCRMFSIHEDIKKLYKFYIDHSKYDLEMNKYFKNRLDVHSILFEGIVSGNSRTSNTAHNEGNDPSNVEKGQEDE